MVDHIRADNSSAYDRIMEVVAVDLTILVGQITMERPLYIQTTHIKYYIRFFICDE